MSENVPQALTIKLLSEELSEVDEWYELGVALGVPPGKLNEIRMSSLGGVGEWRISMLQYWLKSTPNATWEDVINAAKHLRHIVLAIRLKSKYVSQPESGSDGAVPKKAAKIRASVAVVKSLQELEKSFSQMLTRMREFSSDIDLGNSRFFTESVIEAEEFRQCATFEDVLRLIRKSYIDCFNISVLEKLCQHLGIDKMNQLVLDYNVEKEKFLEDSAVTDFQVLVVTSVEHPVKPGKMPEVIIPHFLTNKRTQKDMNVLAAMACGNYQQPYIRKKVDLQTAFDTIWPEYLPWSAWPWILLCIAIIVMLAWYCFSLYSSLVFEVAILKHKNENLMSEIIGHKHKHDKLLLEYAKVENNYTNLVQEIKHQCTSTNIQENLTELVQEVNELMEQVRILTEAKQVYEEEFKSNSSLSGLGQCAMLLSYGEKLNDKLDEICDRNCSVRLFEYDVTELVKLSRKDHKHGTIFSETMLPDIKDVNAYILLSILIAVVIVFCGCFLYQNMPIILQ